MADDRKKITIEELRLSIDIKAEAFYATHVPTQFYAKPRTCELNWSDEIPVGLHLM